MGTGQEVQVSLEAGVLLDFQGRPLYWHLPPNRTGGSLPDSRDLWEVFWENRHQLSGFAHSHPMGMACPSHMDLTTFAAIEAALGRRLDWWIITPDHLVLTRWMGKDELSYKSLPVSQRPEWFAELLKNSNYP